MSKKYLGAGLMSGTSLDGLDIAFCSFQELEGTWKYDIINTSCIDFPLELKNRLKNAPKLTSEDLKKLDIDFGKWMGVQLINVTDELKIKPQFIASHGYTVFHQPDNGFTLQIGSGEEINVVTNLPVINDFRQLDVSMGGQGAPLVPIGDQLLFSQYDFCLNLGGIANVSFDRNHERVAFDICPVNMILNHLAEREGKPYDINGEIARSGRFLPSLYKKLENLDYYNQPYPKSLGYEWVRDNIYCLPEFKKENTKDLAYTSVMHIVNRIKTELNSPIPSYNRKSHVLVTGGGSHNSFLLDMIKKALDIGFEIDKPDKILVDFKEALIFSFLGLLRLKNIPNCLKSVTGAIESSCGGKIIGDHLMGI